MERGQASCYGVRGVAPLKFARSCSGQTLKPQRRLTNPLGIVGLRPSGPPLAAAKGRGSSSRWQVEKFCAFGPVGDLHRGGFQDAHQGHHVRHLAGVHGGNINAMTKQLAAVAIKSVMRQHTLES